MITGMLSNLGFPGPGFWAWLLILVEIVGGAAVLVGFKLKWVTAPLALILFVAIVISPSGMMGALKDIALLSGLVSLWFSGPGNWALGKR